MFKADAAVARPAAAQGGDANGSLRRGKYPRLSARAVWTWMGFGRRCSPNYGPWSGMGIDHATTHADFLADSLHSWLKEDTAWDMAMKRYRSQARAWSEKTYRRTCTFAAGLRPMTRAALQRRGLSLINYPQAAYAGTG